MLVLISALILNAPLARPQVVEELPAQIEFENAGDQETLFQILCPATGTLHLYASSTSTLPELRIFPEELARPVVLVPTVGDLASPYVECDAQEGQVLEIVVSVVDPDLSCTIDLHSSWALETEESALIAESLLADLAFLDLNAPDAPRQVAELSEQFPREAAQISPSLRAAAERFAALSQHLRTPELDSNVRSVLHAYAVAHYPPLDRRRLDAATHLAIARKAAGDLSGARELEVGVLESYWALASEDDRDLQIARLNLAVTLWGLGEIEKAATELRALHASARRALPLTDPILSAAQQNLAAAELELGHARDAAELYRQVVQSMLQSKSPEPVALAVARANLARAFLFLGRPEEAERLLFQAVEAMGKGLPQGHPERVNCEIVYGLTLAQLGDLSAARVIHARILEQQLASHEPDHPAVLRALQGMAVVAFEAGDYARARELHQDIVATRGRSESEQSIELLMARLDLASTWWALGEIDRALSEFEAVAAVLPTELSASHPLITRTRTNLSSALTVKGDLARARPIQESLLAGLLAELPETNPQIQRARNNLAWTLLREDRIDEAARLVSASTQAATERLEGLGPSRVAREIEGMAGRSRTDLDEALSIAARVPPGEVRAQLDAELFDLVESVRTIGLAQIRSQKLLDHATDDETIRMAIEAVRNADAEIVQLSRSGSDEIYRAIQRRDREQRALQAALTGVSRTDRASDTSTTGNVDELRESLAPDEAAVSFWRYEFKTFDRETLTISEPEPHYLAHVVTPDGLERVELGPARAIDDAIDRWRAMVLTPLPRGISLSQPGGDGERSAGSDLRALVLDPLGEALGDATRIRLALDDALHLVPFDALPDGEKGVVGERLQFTYRVDLRRRASTSSSAPQPTLLAMGAIEYDIAPSSTTDSRAVSGISASRSGAPGSLLRSAAWDPGFRFLPETESEVRDLARSFESSLPDGEATLLTGREASREAFERLAPRSTFLHLATHAYFAPESIPSMRDDALDRRGVLAALDAREQVRGFAPMLLCGLAFAGANPSGADTTRLSGLMTAEELSSLDLSNCRLAVLSACETNVGVRRGGQGVASLQSALHAAGVRESIASLWPVPDAATAELMQQFYRALWVKKMGTAEALWHAKSVLRGRRDADDRPVHATRDWAAWVLAGDS